MQRLLAAIIVFYASYGHGMKCEDRLSLVPSHSPASQNRRPEISPFLEKQPLRIAPYVSAYGNMAYMEYVEPSDGAIKTESGPVHRVKAAQRMYASDLTAAERALPDNRPLLTITEGKNAVHVKVHWTAEDLVGETFRGEKIPSSRQLGTPWKDMPESVRQSMASHPTTGSAGINRGVPGRVMLGWEKEVSTQGRPDTAIVVGYTVQVPPGASPTQLANHIAAKLVECGTALNPGTRAGFTAHLKPEELDGMKQMVGEYVNPQRMMASSSMRLARNPTEYKAFSPDAFVNVIKGLVGKGKPLVGNSVWPQQATPYEIASLSPTTPANHPVPSAKPAVVPPPLVVAPSSHLVPRRAAPPAPSQPPPPRPIPANPSGVSPPLAGAGVPLRPRSVGLPPSAGGTRGPTVVSPSGTDWTQRYAMSTFPSNADAQAFELHYRRAVVSATKAVPQDMQALRARLPGLTKEQEAYLVRVHRDALAAPRGGGLSEAAVLRQAFTQFARDLDNPALLTQFRDRVRQFAASISTTP